MNIVVRRSGSAPVEVLAALDEVNRRFVSYIERQHKIWRDKPKKKKRAEKHDDVFDEDDKVVPLDAPLRLRVAEDIAATLKEAMESSFVENEEDCRSAIARYDAFLNSLLNNESTTRDIARDWSISAADMVQPLVKRLATLPHLMSAYPADVIQRARKIAADAVRLGH